MLERIPDSTIDSVAQTHIRSRAVNAWLAELGDAALDALREKASDAGVYRGWGSRPGACRPPRGRSAPDIPRPSLSRRLAGKRMKPSGAKRVAQPTRPALLQCLPACASTATRASSELPTSVTEPASCSAASRDGHAHGSLARVFPVRFRVRCRAVSKIAAPFPFDNAAFNTPYLVYTSCPSAALWAPTTSTRPRGERMYDTGSTTFMLICTMLVFLMTPGLAFSMAACPGAKMSSTPCS